MIATNFGAISRLEVAKVSIVIGDLPVTHAVSSCWSYFIVYVMFVAKKTVVKGEEYLRQFVANSFRHMLARSYGNRTWYV